MRYLFLVLLAACAHTGAPNHTHHDIHGGPFPVQPTPPVQQRECYDPDYTGDPAPRCVHRGDQGLLEPQFRGSTQRQF